MARVVWKFVPGDGNLNRLAAEEVDGTLRVQLLVKKGDVEWKSPIRVITGMTLDAFVDAVKEMPGKWCQLREDQGPPYLAARIWLLPGTNLMLFWRVRHPEVIAASTDIGDEFKIVKVDCNAEWKPLLAVAS